MTFVVRPQASEPAQAMMALFVNRADAYAIQGSRKEIEAGRAYAKIDGPVTLDLLRDHLVGKITIGLYTIDSETQSTRTIVWDLDSDVEEPPTETDWRKIVEKVKPQANKLLEVIKTHKFSLKATLIEFSGFKGVHLWLFFDPPIPSVIAYALGRKIAEEAGVKCEIFPKQKELLKSYGNLVKLPLGIHRGSGLRSVIFDNEWAPVEADYLSQITPEFIMADAPEIRDLKTQLEVRYRPWMEAEVGRGEAYSGEDPPCVVKYLSGISVPIGQRHEIFRRIGCYYLNFKGLAKTEEGWTHVRHILSEWNKHNSPPYDSARFDGEWQKLTEGYEYNYSCHDEYWVRTCDQAHCPLKQAQMQNVPGEVGPEAIQKARELTQDPVAFIKFLQQCLEYRLAGEYANRLFMFLAGVSGKVQTTLVRLYGPNAAGKKMHYCWMEEFFGPDQVITLSSSTAAWLKRKVLKGLDTRGKIIILIEERGDVESGTKYTFEQIYSEDRIKIGFNVRDEGGDWEPIEVTLQGPLTFITTSTEMEESFHAQTREWEVNPDESHEQSQRISDWFDWRELRSIKQLEAEKKQIEVIRAYLSLLKPFNRYIIPFIRNITFKYRTLGDRRKKPDLANLIRTTTYLFQELCPKDDENKIIFAAPFTFDIVLAAAADIIAVSRGGINRTERKLLDFLTNHYDEVVSVTKEGKQPDADVTRDGKLIREGHPAEAFTATDITQRGEFSDLHENSIKNNLRSLTRKGWLLQTVSGKGRTGVWTQPNKDNKKAIVRSNDEKTALIPGLSPISGPDLDLTTSQIYEGLDRRPDLQPAWDTILPIQNCQVVRFRIEPETTGFAPERLESAALTSQLPIEKNLSGAQLPQPLTPAGGESPLFPFKITLKERKDRAQENPEGKEGSA